MSRLLASAALRVAAARPAAAASASASLAASLPVRSLHLASARLGPHHVPVGPHSNIDGVYRRPSVPKPTAPLSEDDEMMWDDDQAPEPVFDEEGRYDRMTALRNLTIALTVTFGGGLGLVYLSDPESRRVAAPQEYAFDSLRLSRGGINGAPIKKE